MLAAALSLRGAPFHASAGDAVRQAHTELCGRLLSPAGLLWDYVGELPTARDCAERRPNAMGWSEDWEGFRNAPLVQDHSNQDTY